MDKKYAGLFDLDGVIFDTEMQYTHFWDHQGSRFCNGEAGFGLRIKGHTLKDILEEYFPAPALQEEIIAAVNAFEAQMAFVYIAGALEFIRALRAEGIATAVVTSSDKHKMQHVYRQHPAFTGLFDTVVTADKISRSKPDPECYLLAAEELGIAPAGCVVFEDSFAGLASGRSAGMYVVGLSTTNPYEAIKEMADVVISDFTRFRFPLSP